MSTKPPALAELSDAQRETAMARFAVLRPHLQDGAVLASAARAAGVPPRTAQRWLARYQEFGRRPTKTTDHPRHHQSLTETTTDEFETSKRP